MSWKAFETRIREIASEKYNTLAREEYLFGVRCDCVLRPEPGRVIVIEITEQNSLEKLRKDISKLQSVRNGNMMVNIFTKCIYVMKDEPTSAMIDTGKCVHIDVLSMQQFLAHSKVLLKYIEERNKRAFGSAVDTTTGDPDNSEYVKVKYHEENGDSYTVLEICDLLIEGRNIVLLGDYGSGKSRCVKEVFGGVSSLHSKHYKTPLAINLKENWGLRRAIEIINRHFGDMGLEECLPEIKKKIDKPSIIYLLDGFDELGYQTWSTDPNQLIQTRRAALSGVRELVGISRGGLLITGREHYFNNQDELLTATGLTMKKPLILKCSPGFNDEQFSELINFKGRLPQWLPKKPLFGAIIRQLEQDFDLKGILDSGSGHIDFWEKMMESVCAREAKINIVLDESTIRKLYVEIGRLTRYTTNELGPISITSLTESFEKTTARSPIDESALILHRLPGLGRTDSDSFDRQFIDTFILDGLKATDVLNAINTSKNVGYILAEEWRNPIGVFGATFLASKISNMNYTHKALTFLKYNIGSANKILLSDIVTALSHNCIPPVDFSNITLQDGKFQKLSLTDKRISNIKLNECYIDLLDISDSKSDKVIIENSLIINLHGATSGDHLPGWIKECEIGNYQQVDTLAHIRNAGLNDGHQFLLSCLKKLFIQPGSGRQEDSLLKGFGGDISNRTFRKVLKLLISEKFCTTANGKHGVLYIPNRSMMKRVSEMQSQLTNSNDPLWKAVTII